MGQREREFLTLMAASLGEFLGEVAQKLNQILAVSQHCGGCCWETLEPDQTAERPRRGTVEGPPWGRRCHRPGQREQEGWEDGGKWGLSEAQGGGEVVVGGRGDNSGQGKQTSAPA